MKKAILLACMLLSCDRLLRRGQVDAGSTTTVTTSTSTSTSTSVSTSTPDDEEEPVTVDAGGPCPVPIHPGYCRRRCRSFNERQAGMHARRIISPVRAGTGKCDAYKVFAEDDARGGIVEYYDETNQLVGVTDSRQKPCGTYGKIPQCKLDIQWGEARARK